MSKVFASGGQLLNSTFFPNPADIAKIKTFEFRGGNLFFVPTLTFKGTAHGKTGTAKSSVYDPIPYLYTSYRINNKLAVGINMLPSLYGDLSWPGNSLIAYNSVITNVLFYRSGVLASYQITPELALGVGVNLEREYLELSFLTKTAGFERNKTAGYNYVTDFGIYYKLTSSDGISLAYYTPVDSVIKGVSRAGKLANYNYAALNTNAAVSFLSVDHIVNSFWVVNGAIYFSKWSTKKNMRYYNTVTAPGTSIFPEHWKNVWSFVFTSSHVTTDKTRFCWQVLYETNPSSGAQFNYVAFPLSSALNFSASFEYNFYQNFYIKVIGSYGTFAPKSRINTSGNFGTISANIYTGALEGSFRI